MTPGVPVAGDDDSKRKGTGQRAGSRKYSHVGLTGHQRTVLAW